MEPKRKSFRDKDEGAVVFATQRKGLAASFMSHVKNPDDYPDISVINRKPVVLIPKKKEFLKNDTGGAIYKLRKSKSFHRDHPKSYHFGVFEWITRRKVKPIEKKVYDSSIDAMIDNGAIVYFVTKKQQKDFRKLANEKEPSENSKLRSFFNKLTSENEKRGKLKKKKWWK